jgi:hypothetical protein
MLIICTCCYDLTKGTQDKDFSYSFSILSHCAALVYQEVGASRCRKTGRRASGSATVLCGTALWLEGRGSDVSWRAE